MRNIRYTIPKNISIGQSADRVYILNTKKKTLLVKPKKLLKILELLKHSYPASNVYNDYGISKEEIHSMIDNGVIKKHYPPGNYPRKHLEFYNINSKLCNDHRHIFMNHGYAELERSENFEWLDEEDKNQKYSFNLAKQLLKNTDISTKLVLDVGCGRGGLCYYMYKYLDPKKIYGLDNCKGNIVFCKRRFISPRVSFVHGDAHYLPFANNSFHVVTNLESSHCYPYSPIFFQEVYRVLKRKGFFCYADSMPGDTKQFKTIIDNLIDTGFEIVQKKDIAKNVAKAIDLDRKKISSFFRSLTKKSSESKRLFESLIKYITKDAYKAYLKGSGRYIILILKKQ
jgi:ubiquinone/menaquinone biosynthesis C-methylase UbiE